MHFKLDWRQKHHFMLRSALSVWLLVFHKPLNFMHTQPVWGTLQTSQPLWQARWFSAALNLYLKNWYSESTCLQVSLVSFGENFALRRGKSESSLLADSKSTVVTLHQRVSRLENDLHYGTVLYPHWVLIRRIYTRITLHDSQFWFYFLNLMAHIWLMNACTGVNFVNTRVKLRTAIWI